LETGRARLRKYVVTENVTTTVPVSHEEVRVEREPITDADAAGTVRGGELGEEEQEVTLHAERPVVDKEAVPVEKVRLDTETVTDEEKVTEQVRKERIEAEGDGTSSTRKPVNAPVARTARQCRPRRGRHHGPNPRRRGT
uniref:YsnF/AvaK domain-containing protein n=1 Tax=Arthrobacter sp. JCM 19049 TaxID=1460643 RepID=UPI0024369CA0